MAPIIAASFAGGSRGQYRITQITPVIGEGLAPVARLATHERAPLDFGDAAWTLRGTTGHVRYVAQREKVALAAVQPLLGRPEATCAALIPIRKSDAWWDLAQDERRAIFEERSRHIAVGLDYLPAVARRLYQSRELGEPFDFLTWFEYAPEHAARFEQLVAALRATEEWRYVEREVDIRLVKENANT
jgi:chlorite dismutase